MSAPPRTTNPCRVVGGEKLPPETGGADAICAAVQRAVAGRAPNLRYSAEIRVLSRSALAANLESEGRKLPEMKFAVSDRNLGSTSIDHFADAVATALTEAGSR